MTSFLSETRDQFGNNINYYNNAASRQVVAPGARIGQLPSRKSRYFPNTSGARLHVLDTLSLFYYYGLLLVVDVCS